MLVGRTTVRVTWLQSTDIGGSGIAGYQVYRGGSLISGPNLVTGLTYQDSNLSYRTTYSYTVVAVTNSGNLSSASAAASVTTDWQLVFQDDFNRSDNFLYASGNWAGCAYWEISRLQAFTPYGLNAYNWYDCYYQSAQTDVRVTLDLLGTSWNGITLWTEAAFLSNHPRAYRILRAGSQVFLNYYPDASTSSASTLAFAQGAGTGTFRVQATSATRNVKVYYNNALLIDYTETDTSRPNSGLVGFTAWLINPGNYSTVDNFMLEK